MIIVGFIIFAVLLIIGAPLWLTLGMSGGIWLFVHMGMPVETISSQFFIAIDSWILLAVPYFLLAGNLMTYMGPANKLFQFINNLVGHLPGGLTSAVVVAAAIFGTLSGSSIATVVAVGSMAIPQMLASGYSKKNSYGVVAASGTLGQLIPPSIFMILFAAETQLDPGILFMAGIVPGILMAIIFIIIAIVIGIREGAERPEKVSFKETSKSFLHAIPPLLMPIIILGGIYGGIFTPTEAAGVAVGYTIIISFIFNRKEFTKNNFRSSLVSTMVTTSVVYLLLGGAKLFSIGMTYLQLPQMITEFVTQINLEDWVIMFLIIILFVMFGTILDAIPIIYITLPILYPLVLAMGYDPVHFAVITVASLMIGQITPPIGASLYAISGHFKENLSVVVKGSVPYLIGMIFTVIVLALVPWFSLFLIQ